MTNGQVNVTAIAAVTQMVTPDQSGSIGATIDGVQQNSGDFAEMLSGMQSVLTVKTVAAAGQSDLKQIIMNKDQNDPPVAADGQAADLLMQLHVSALMTLTLAPAVPHRTDSAKMEATPATDPLSTKPTDAISQLIMAAYSQPGRMPTTDIQAQPLGDLLQNVAATQQPTVIPVVPTTPPPEATLGTVDVKMTLPPPVDKRQNGTASPQPAVISAVPTEVQPEVTLGIVDGKKPLPVTVDRRQNAPTVTNSATVDIASPDKKLMEQIAVELTGTASQETNAISAATSDSDFVTGQKRVRQLETVKTTTVPLQSVAPEYQAKQTEAPAATTMAVQPEATLRIPEGNKPVPAPVDGRHSIELAKEQATVNIAPAVINKSEQFPVEKAEVTQQEPAVSLAVNPPTETTVPVQNSQLQPETIITTSDRSLTIAVTTQEIQEKPAITMSVPTVFLSVPTTDPSGVTSIAPGVNKDPLHAERLQNVAIIADQPDVIIAPPVKSTTEQTVAGSIQTEHASTLAIGPSAIPVTASSQELELKRQLTQPEPITARMTAAAVLTDNRSATPVLEIRGARRLPPTEQQNEKVLTTNEPIDETEISSSEQLASPGIESTFDSESSADHESNLEQRNGTNENQVLIQNMRGQSVSEHQKTSPVSSKTVMNDTVKQDVPEQIMQQVKERLVLHDVKSGNQQITLTLSPDGLGELKMNLNLQGQKLSVEIVTENRTVTDAIVQHTNTLKESLARQNITMESFDVTTGGKGSENQGQNQGAWKELAKQQQFWTSPRGYQTARVDLPPELEGNQRQQSQSMLDIHY